MALPRPHNRSDLDNDIDIDIAVGHRLATLGPGSSPRITMRPSGRDDNLGFANKPQSSLTRACRKYLFAVDPRNPLAQEFRCYPSPRAFVVREGYEGPQRIDIIGRRALGMMGVGSEANCA